MPGNSQRKGSVRKSAKKPTAGSGGRVKRGLEGRGPTPKAKDRPYHQAHKDAKRKAAKSSAARPKRRTTGDAEWIAGRNPATYVAVHYLKLIDFSFGPAWRRQRVALAADRRDRNDEGHAHREEPGRRR